MALKKKSFIRYYVRKPGNGCVTDGRDILALGPCIRVRVINKVDNQNNSTEMGLLLALYLKISQ